MSVNKLSSLLNWKLQTGSHKFPGPDGGTCINEAAIVVAGFKYKSISSASDCPPCFSVVFSSYLLTLNDKMPDDVRQKLIPFATKLAGSADSNEIERERCEYIIREVTHRIVAPMLDKDYYPKHAKALRAANTMQEIKVAASNAADDAAHVAYAASAASAAAYAAAAYAVNAAYAAHVAHVAAADDAAYAAYAAWDIAIDIANEAFAIGKQADPIEENVIKERIEKIKYGSRSGRDVSLVRTSSG